MKIPSLLLTALLGTGSLLAQDAAPATPAAIIELTIDGDAMDIAPLNPQKP